MFEPGHIPYLLHFIEICIELKFETCLLRNRNDRKFHIYNIYHSIYPFWAIFACRYLYHCNDNNLNFARHVNSFTQLTHCGFFLHLCEVWKFNNEQNVYNVSRIFNILKVKYLLLWYFVAEINVCLDLIFWTMLIKI